MIRHASLLPRAMPFAVALVLAGCGAEAPEEQPSGAPGAAPSAPAPPIVQAFARADAIPPALHGRWAEDAADCEAGRAEAQGLLVIGPERLEFYESVGTLGNIEQVGLSSLRARFAFTGEGVAWERRMALTVGDGGDTLVRREYGEDAAPGPFRYDRC